MSEVREEPAGEGVAGCSRREKKLYEGVSVSLDNSIMYRVAV